MNTNDYMVKFNGQELTLEDYLEMKELESVMEFPLVEMEAEKEINLDEIELTNDYAVVCHGKKMSLEEYLITKECELFNIAA